MTYQVRQLRWDAQRQEMVVLPLDESDWLTVEVARLLSVAPPDANIKDILTEAYKRRQ
jgi:hypothetical protein